MERLQTTKIKCVFERESPSPRKHKLKPPLKPKPARSSTMASVTDCVFIGSAIVASAALLPEDATYMRLKRNLANRQQKQDDLECEFKRAAEGKTGEDLSAVSAEFAVRFKMAAKYLQDAKDALQEYIHRYDIVLGVATVVTGPVTAMAAFVAATM